MKTVKIKQATKKGYIECNIGGVADLSYPNSKTRRGRVQDNGDTCPTITAESNGLCRIEESENTTEEYRIRKLTPKECWRLMGFDDEDFEKAAFEKKEIKGDDLIRNAKLKDVIEKQIQGDMAIYVLNIIKGLRELGLTSIEWTKLANKHGKEKDKPANIVIEKLVTREPLECAINITKCLESTEILCSLIKKNATLPVTVIIGLGKKDKGNTEEYMKITSDENLNPMKLYIILTVLKLIIESKISISTLQTVNIPKLTLNCETLKNSTEKMQISALKMEGIFTRISNSSLYKQAGNSIVVDVLYYIFKELYTAMPYLFDNLKVGSYFSGIGAFECALDRIFEDIESGDIGEVNFT